MGLDMYLYAERYIGENYTYNEVEISHEYTSIGKTKKLQFPIESIRMHLIYWRKANQIHNWFVDNVQRGQDDVSSHLVSREQLEKLIETIAKVQTAGDEETVLELLPPLGGPLFGSTEIDEDYWGEIEHTKTELEKVLEEVTEEDDLYYDSSW